MRRRPGDGYSMQIMYLQTLEACVRPIFRSACLAAIVLAVLTACTATPEVPQRIWIARHAEKLPGDDPALSPAGLARAQELAREIRHVDAIYSTDTLRTRSTAAPLAKRLGQDVQLYDHRDPAALAERIRASGQSALIVGHSNTIAGLAAAFGVDPGKEVRENEYDRLYIITLDPQGAKGEIRRYGDAPLMEQ